jgi:hypothetical protein
MFSKLTDNNIKNSRFTTPKIIIYTNQTKTTTPYQKIIITITTTHKRHPVSTPKLPKIWKRSLSNYKKKLTKQNK